MLICLRVDIQIDGFVGFGIIEELMRNVVDVGDEIRARHRELSSFSYLIARLWRNPYHVINYDR